MSCFAPGYANRKHGEALSTQTVALQVNEADKMNDAGAQAFVEATIAQFQKGKWQRYADPEWEVLLTGRSSILDAKGEVGGDLMTIDPNYKMSPEDWRVVARSGGIWRWLGDGVVAKLTVRNSPGADGKDWYDMELEFELLDVQRKRDADNLARDLKEGDAKGWNSTAEHETNKRKITELNKLLKANAIKRGDAVVEIAPH